MMFHVGQKVVCVDDKFDHPSWDYVLNKPRLNGVYTVRGITQEMNFVGIFLDEILNIIDNWRNGDREMSFPVHKFRPLLERKTDISFAHEILRKHTHKNRERA